MKVLIIRNAFTHDFGGAERLAVHMAKEIGLNNIDAVVLSRQPRLLAYARAQGVTCYRGWWWSRQNWSGRQALLSPVYLLWQFVLTIWYLQLIARLHVDVVHAFSKDDFIASTFAARLLGRRVVWTDPADLKHIFANHKVWYKNPVGKLIFLASKLASHITLVSYSEKKLIETSLGRSVPERFIVVHTAGKDEQVEPIERTSEDERTVVFCSTSRLVKAKGIGELVQAFNKLSQGSDAFRLWLVGDGPDQETFMREAGGNDYIHFIGHSEKPLAYVAASDVFVHPTHHEGFSLSLAEAAMLGKPMVATNVGGNPELVNDRNGILVPARDIGALYKALRRLGTDKGLRERLGKQARKDYINNFDFSHIIKDRFIPLYEQAVKN